MDKLITPVPSNGFPLNNDDIKFFLGVGSYSAGVYQALESILSIFGTDFIISGCVVSGSSISEGWIMLDSELIKVDAHTSTDNYFEKVITYNSDGNKQTQLGGLEDSYQQNRATATASSGTLTITGDKGEDIYLKRSKLYDIAVLENVVTSDILSGGNLLLTLGSYLSSAKILGAFAQDDDDSPGLYSSSPVRVNYDISTGIKLRVYNDTGATIASGSSITLLLLPSSTVI